MAQNRNVFSSSRVNPASESTEILQTLKHYWNCSRIRMACFGPEWRGPRRLRSMLWWD